MDCSSFIASEDTYEFIVPAGEIAQPAIAPDCIQTLGDKYEIWYYNRGGIPLLSISEDTYSSIPKCYGLLDSTSLGESGILKLQNQPTLSLKGQGVFVAVIDTGIRYQDAAFFGSDQKTRIYSIWDQTGTDGAPPEGFLYGTEYTRQRINEALESEEPERVVPQRDTNGHGTFLASVACGSGDLAADFTGAAPEAELIVVKLKPAKQALRDFYFIPQQTETYAESDIMTAVSYANRIAQRENRPLVIFLGLGNNNGSHTGSGPLAEFLGAVGAQRHRAAVVAAGNEANNRHHFFGRSDSMLTPLKVEINVPEQMNGFYAEFWALAPDLFSVVVQSPTGEKLPKSADQIIRSQSYTFLFEGTTLNIDYHEGGRGRRDQLIWLHFANVPRGIWTILVYPWNIINGYFHVWLPMAGMLERDVYFLTPDPEVTLTAPSDAVIPMTAGGYHAANGALYLESGRGYNADGSVKPDFLAPAVGVQGKDLRGGYTTRTGTSAAAAITAGACAQVLEWAVTRGNGIGINSVDIQNFLIRGAARESGQTYPTPEYGFGKLDVYRAFELLR